MKKFIIALSVAVLTVSAYAMSKKPADASACGADKTCTVKEAAKCCTADGSCKADAACKVKAASATCGGPCAGSCGCEGKKDGKACTCEDAMKKAAEEKAGCTGGVCPLKK